MCLESAGGTTFLFWIDLLNAQLRAFKIDHFSNSASSDQASRSVFVYLVGDHVLTMCTWRLPIQNDLSRVLRIPIKLLGGRAECRIIPRPLGGKC